MTTLLTASSVAVLAVLMPLLGEVPEANDVNAGWGYPAVIGVLILAMVLLWRSMRKQLKRIDFDEKTTDQSPPAGQDR